MRDEHDGQIVHSVQFAQEFDDPRLDRHVERRRGLVTDQHPWPEGQCARDHRALALAAADLVGVSHREVRTQPGGLEEFASPGAPLLFGADAMDLKRFLDLAAYRGPGIKGQEGILRHELHGTREGDVIRGAENRNRLAHERGRTLARGLNSEHELADCGFAAAALADHGQAVAFIERQRDAGHRPELAAARVIVAGRVVQ